MPFYLWSSTASANATGDPSINWAEGMAPSAVNDSARAMMARLKEYNNDIAGGVVTAGTSTAYTLATYQVFNTLANMNAAMVAFTPHATNGATVTLNVDGLGAKPLRFGPNLELQSGVLIQGTPYVVTYNNSDGAFYLQGGFANPYGIPLGGLLPYTAPSAPSSAFVLTFGQAISRTTYATYFALVGTNFGAGDGSTTFNVPDLRGRAIFGVDNMGGSAAGRITAAGGNFDGMQFGQVGGSQNQTLTQAQLPATSITPSFTGGTFASGQWFVTNSNGNTSSIPVTSGTGNYCPGFNTNTYGSVQPIPAGTVSAVTFGSGNSHPILPPACVIAYILRVI